MKTGNPIPYLFKMMWRFSEGHRGRVVTYVSMSIFAGASSLFLPLVLAKVLNVVQEQGVTQANIPFLLFLLSLFLVQTLFFWALHGPARVMERENAYLVRTNYQQFLIDGVMGLPLAWHTDHHSGDTIDKVKKGTSSMFQFSGGTFEYIDTFVRFFGSLIALAYFDLTSAGVAILITVIAVSIILRFDKTIIPLHKENNTMDNAIAAKIYDVISNISTVIILRVQHLLSSEILKIVLKPLRVYRKRIKLNEWKWFVVSAASSSMFLLVIGSYLWGTIRIGDVVFVGTISALYGYTQRINGVFSRSAYLYNSAVQWRVDVANAEELSEEFAPLLKHGTRDKRHMDWKELNIQSLNFSYHEVDEKRHVEYDLQLNDVSMVLKKGEKVAIIGESGSGKTTFLQLFRGLYKPNSGELVLDDKKLSGGFDDISRDIALIPQEPEIFTTTIRDNVTIGIDHTDGEIKNYTDLAMFTDVVDRLPKGLDSNIVEKGVNLSGGEKQRLALARGLMASEDKSVVLLDESTSSVDPVNEAAIYENIFSAYKDKTIIATIHKLHLLRMFETIYLFDQGGIIGRGSFDELLEKSEKFQAMWKNYTNIQAQGRV